MCVGFHYLTFARSPCYARRMNVAFGRTTLLMVLALLLGAQAGSAAETFRVATYNLEGYLNTDSQTRRAKPAEAKTKVRESIRAMNPDVIALQEVGGILALQELRLGLKSDGLDFPFWEFVPGHDTNIQVAILSRFPITASRPHTNDTFLLNGRRHFVSRGFADVEIQVKSNYSFNLLSGHLKSKRPVGSGDESELRLEEAKLMRQIIDERLASAPDANLVVLGDFNDTKDSPALKTLVGRGRRKLVDTRPAEQNPDGCAASISSPREITWTHYYAVEDTYSRIDYLLLSPGMAAEWVTNKTYVLTLPGWGIASDHRPLVAAFTASDQ